MRGRSMAKKTMIPAKPARQAITVPQTRRLDSEVITQSGSAQASATTSANKGPLVPETKRPSTVTVAAVAKVNRLI